MTEVCPRRNPLWVAYEYLAMVIGLGSLAIICLGWLPFALLLRPILSPTKAQALGRRVNSGGFRVYLFILEMLCACRFELDELDRLRDSGPLILAANHPSLLDAVMIISRLPNAVCVMKASLMDNILFGAAARMARYVRNDEPLPMILNSRDALNEGAHLIIFPEGTRTAEFPIGPCLPSIGLIANRAKVPVQTLLISFSTPYLGKAWPLFRRPQLPLRVSVRLGRSFPPPKDVTRFTADLEAYFHHEFGPDFPSTVEPVAHA